MCGKLAGIGFLVIFAFAVIAGILWDKPKESGAGSGTSVLASSLENEQIQLWIAEMETAVKAIYNPAHLKPTLN